MQRTGGRAQPRGRRRPLATGIALLVALGAALPASAQPAHEPGPAASAAQLSLLRLLGRTPWVGDGLDFELSVQVVAAPPGSQLQVTVHGRVGSRSEFNRSIEGDDLRTRISGPRPVPVDQLDPDGDGTVGLLVPLVAGEAGPAVPITRAGVYPVVVDLLDADGEELATLRTHLVRLPAFDSASDDVPLAVTVVVPVHAPPADLDAATDAPAAVPVEAVTTVGAALAAHPDVPVVLAATPESLAAVAATDPDAVADLASDLGGSEVLTAPWVDVEEAAWARADAGTLARLRARGDQTLAALLNTTPSPDRVAATGSSLAEIASYVDGGATAVVVAGDDLEPLDSRRFPYTLARPFDLALTSAGDDGSVVRAVAGDSGLATLAATASDDPILAAHLVLADLAVIAADENDSARVATLVLPAVAAASPAFLAALLGGLEPPVAPAPPPAPVDPSQPTAPAIPAAAPVVVASTLDAALASVAPAGSRGIAAGPGDPLVRQFADDGSVGDVGAVADRLARIADDVASYRTVFGPADPAAARFDDVLATAAADELRAGERTAALASISSAIHARLAGLQPPARQQVRLTDREGRIQLVLTNQAGAEADVTLQLRGDRLVFPDAPDGVLPVHLEAGSTRVDVRVRARSSGDAPLDIRLTSPDGRLLLGESRITVRTTAFSGVGIVLMGAAAVFLAVWWTRTIVKERRTSRRRHPSHLRKA